MLQKIVVTQEREGMRLDKFLVLELEGFSRARINHLIKEGKVSVDGRVRKPSFRLRENQKISLLIKEEKRILRPYKFKVKIIYEDNDIIVVDKPAGLTTHPPQEHYYKTLVNALLYLKKNLSGLNLLRPGVVHRLDKETSGIMVLAKNNFSQENLVEQFKKRKVKKEYFALVWGELKREEFKIALPLNRDKRNRLKMKISLRDSKEAFTEVKVIKKLKKATLLSLKPLTGRTHQLRVHLNFLGFPIVGDKKYGLKDKYKELFLHAYRLSFCHPQTGKYLEFNSPLPERFNNFICEHK